MSEENHSLKDRVEERILETSRRPDPQAGEYNQLQKQEVDRFRRFMSEMDRLSDNDLTERYLVK